MSKNESTAFITALVFCVNLVLVAPSHTAEIPEESQANTPAAGFALPPAKALPGNTRDTAPAKQSQDAAKIPAARTVNNQSKAESAQQIAMLPPANANRTSVQETILPNGLRVLFLEMHEFPVVSTLMWYRTGSRAEKPGTTGLSHLVEHLLFQNVGSFKEGEIGASIARAGGQFNGYTSDDFITFFETLPSQRLELALKIEAERMRQAKFEDSAIAKEVENIQKEFENEERDPIAMVSREVRALLFMQHPYHNPVLGWRSDLENLTSARAKEFYDRYFQPGNATLVVCGDVNSKTTLPLVHKYFGSIPAGPAAKDSTPVETQSRGERRVNMRYNGKQEILQMGWHAPSLDSSDAAAMVVLEKVLNGGLNGRLKVRLTDAKLCATAGASYEIKKEPGFFTITGSSLPATLNAQQKMIDGIDAVLAQLRDKPVSDGELRRARNQSLYAFHSECDGPYRAGFHLGYFDSLDKWQDSYTWPERLRGVTANDIMRVAKKYLTSEGRVVGWVQGNQAPKPATQPQKTGAESPKEHEKSFPTKLEHVRMSGYKTDDSAESPEKVRAKGKQNDTAKAEAKKVSTPADTTKAETKKADKPVEKVKSEPANTAKSTQPRSQSDNKTDKPSPTATNHAARPLTRSLPRIIEEIPEAIGKAGSGAVNNVGSAIKSVPGAIGELGVAVGHTASALGNKIAQLGPRPEPVNGRVSRRVLHNGVTLLVFESHVSPIVHVTGSIEAGDIYAPADKPGLSAVTTALLNQGGPRHNHAQMLSLQDDLGIASQHMLRFDNRMETIDFQFACLSKDLNSQFDLLAESVASPAMDDASLDHARQEAQWLLKKSEESMNQKVDRVLMQCLLAEKSPYCPADPTDKSKSISTISGADIQRFASAHVVPGALTLAVAGDIHPDQAASMLEKAFQGWNGRATHQKLHAKESSKRVLRTAIPSKESKKSTVCFGQLVPVSAGHVDYGSLLIADGILVNHPMISRFEQQIAKAPALESAINSGDMQVGLDPVSNLAKWSLTVSVEPAAVPIAVQALRKELKQISRTGVTPAEFAEVRRYVAGLLGVRDESTLYRVARNELDLALHGGTVDGYAAVMNGLRLSTPETVNRVIRTAFQPDLSTLVIAGSAQSIKSVRTKGSDNSSGTEQPAIPASDNVKAQ
jgi:zinc protease